MGASSTPSASRMSLATVTRRLLLACTAHSGLAVRTPNPSCLEQVRSATKKAGGASDNKSNPGNPKYRGVKKFGGEWVDPGNIIVKQLGTKWHPGEGVGVGKDHTLYALTMGRVFFEKTFHAEQRGSRRRVHVTPINDPRQKHKWKQMPFPARQ